MRNTKSKVALIIVSILIVAVLGSVFVNLGSDWFNSLDKPSQWIPNIVIPIVWTVVYVVFGILLSVWVSREPIPMKIVVWLFINGILNILWCLVFFTLELTFLGNIVIILNLWAGIILFYQIYNHKSLYGLIVSIYPVWLSIATTLNTAMWILN